MAERVQGLSVVIIRQAGEGGGLYGSVSPRDVAVATSEAGADDRPLASRDVPHPIKTVGVTRVRVTLHPEVSIWVGVNVARSPEEAERQARGERVGAEAEEADTDLETLFDPDVRNRSPRLEPRVEA